MNTSLTRRPELLKAGLSVSVAANIILVAALLWPSQAVETPALSITGEATANLEEEMQFEDESVELQEVVVEVPKAPAAVEAAAPAIPADGIHTVFASLNTSIPHTLSKAAAPYGDNVSATLSRLLVWDLDVRKDLRPNDTIEAMWTLGTSDVVVIQAARYFSQKSNQTIAAYRFHAKGDRYPSYWSADGVEIPHTLKKSPLAEYEQITSLLKDRPTHHGMDFKVDVGTPIVTPFDGVVTRVNWNLAANGNCVEIQHADGVLAKYLHLSNTKVKAGARVKAGELIALSGNTGRSTGPHLHYQLNQGSKVIDPVTYHGTIRRTLPEGERAQFKAIVDAANARLDSSRALASN